MFDEEFAAFISWSTKTGKVEFAEVSHEKMLYFPELRDMEDPRQAILQRARVEVDFISSIVTVQVPYVNGACLKFYAKPAQAELVYAPHQRESSKPVIEYGVDVFATKYQPIKADQTRRDFKEMQKAVPIGLQLMLNGQRVDVYRDPRSLPDELLQSVVTLIRGKPLDSNSFLSSWS